MPDDTPSNSPALSWRDVYKAVGESETRVVAAINDLATRLLNTTGDHENRLRVVEAQSSQVPILKIEETALAVRVSALENHNQREQGVFTTLGAGKTFLLVLSGILSPIIAVVALISHTQ
jgi:hypothetical protein